MPGLRCGKCGNDSFDTLISFQGSPAVEDETEDGFCWECTKKWIDGLMFITDKGKENQKKKRK